MIKETYQLLERKQRELAQTETTIKAIDFHLAGLKDDFDDTDDLVTTYKKEVRNSFIYALTPIVSSIFCLVIAITSPWLAAKIVLGILSAVALGFGGFSVATGIKGIKDIKKLEPLIKADREVSKTEYTRLLATKHRLQEQRTSLKDEINDLIVKLNVEKANEIPKRLIEGEVETKENSPESQQNEDAEEEKTDA